MEKTKNVSWGWTIFWLIVFWPIGLVLVIKNMSNDKSMIMSGKTTLISIIGWLLISFGAIALIGISSESSSSDNGGAIFIVFLMIIGGIVLLNRSAKAKKDAIKFKRYIDMIVNQENRSLDNIAAAIGISYDIVIKDIQNMIDIGYLKDAYIHQGNREIIIKNAKIQQDLQNVVPNEKPIQSKSERCPGCGANVVVPIGRISECDYCGTSING